MPEWRICALRQHTLPLGTEMPCKSAGLKRNRRRTARGVPCKASKLTTYWWAELGSYITYDRKHANWCHIAENPSNLTSPEWTKSTEKQANGIRTRKNGPSPDPPRSNQNSRMTELFVTSNSDAWQVWQLILLSIHRMEYFSQSIVYNKEIYM